MKDLLDLTLHQISEAVWKATITFFIIPCIAWYVFTEYKYEWYEHMFVVLIIFILTWLSFMTHFILVVLLIKEKK